MKETQIQENLRRQTLLQDSEIIDKISKYYERILKAQGWTFFKHFTGNDFSTEPLIDFKKLLKNVGDKFKELFKPGDLNETQNYKMQVQGKTVTLK